MGIGSRASPSAPTASGSPRGPGQTVRLWDMRVGPRAPHARRPREGGSECRLQPRRPLSRERESRTGRCASGTSSGATKRSARSKAMGIGSKASPSAPTASASRAGVWTRPCASGTRDSGRALRTSKAMKAGPKRRLQPRRQVPREREWRQHRAPLGPRVGPPRHAHLHPRGLGGRHPGWPLQARRRYRGGVLVRDHLCRFEPGELDPYLPERLRRLAPEERIL